MTSTSNGSGKRGCRRLRGVHIVRGVSVLANLALAGRIIAVDPIARFHPLCRVHRTVGYIRLKEPLSLDFIREMHMRMPRSRLGAEPGTNNYRLYIPLWDYLREHDDYIYYDLTARVLNKLYERNELGRRMMREEFFSTQTMDCPFVRRWAVKQDPS